MSKANAIRVGSRESPLALAQTEEIVCRLRSLYPGESFIIKRIKTRGDLSPLPFSQMGRGIFVKELENALLTGEIDLGVHSLKDLPTELPHALMLGAVGQRRDARDVLVSRWGLPLGELPLGAGIGTSSPRRAAQLRAFRSDFEVMELRGNVETRLRKASSPPYDGVVVAAAGIIRLGREGEITQYLPLDIMVPAVGQGALAVEVRAEDGEIRAMVSALDDTPTRRAITAEQAFLRSLGGGCQLPMAAYGEANGSRLRLWGMVARPNGTRVIRGEVTGSWDEPEALGHRLAQELLGKGAGEIMRGKDR